MESRLFLFESIDTNVMDEGIPEYFFSVFQGKFAIITPALIAGAFAERVTFKAYILFIALWSLLVYNPLCVNLLKKMKWQVSTGLTMVKEAMEC